MLKAPASSSVSETIRQIGMKSDEKILRPGDYLFHQGEEDPHFYLVLGGDLEVLLKDQTAEEKVIAYVHEGEILGEGVMSGIIIKPASARALTPVRLLAFHENDFQRLLEENPEAGNRFLRAVLNLLHERLSATNHKLMILFDVISLLHEHADDFKGLCGGLLQKLESLAEAGEGVILLKHPLTGQFEPSCSTSSFWDSLDLGQLSFDEPRITEIEEHPLLCVNFKTFGAVILSRPKGAEPFTTESLRMTQLVADQVGDILEAMARRAEEKARAMLRQKRYTL